jgi:hypothetical protein
MSDENFVARWSRLKRETAKEEAFEAGKRPPPREPGDAEDRAAAIDASHEAAGQPSAAPFDVTSLPPVESITVGSDIRAFLQAGVPAELTKAALRRAWTTDPAIRDFIGIAENQWDFTDPTAIPGFGPLQSGDDVQKLVSQAMGKLSEIAEPKALDTAPTKDPPESNSPPLARQAPDIPTTNESRAGGATLEPGHNIVSAASHHTDREPATPPGLNNRRKHGGALPQ